MVTIIIAKVNNIPGTNSYPNTSANPTMVTIIIVKPYDIPVANTFKYARRQSQPQYYWYNTYDC